MSQVDKDYEDLLLGSWEKGNEQITHIIYAERKTSMQTSPKFHSRSNHEYHMKKWGRCVYCDNHIPIREDE